MAYDDDQLDLDEVAGDEDLAIPNEDGEIEEDEDEESLGKHGFHDPDELEEESF